MMHMQALRVRHPPIILLGMHRSGTSLIARLLEDLGLFQGARLQEDHESVWFMELNDLLLKRIGAAWDNPAPVNDFLHDPRALDLTTLCIRSDLLSKRVTGYLGLKRYLQYRSLEELDHPWGWKDPRTVFTLPVWLRLFPEARLVYIVRNGVDVASSLRVREQRELTRRIDEFDVKSKRFNNRLLLDRAGFKGSARCLTLEGGFSLWEQYVAQAEAALADSPNQRMIVHYEQFLAEPQHATQGLAPLARFCGLEPAQAVLDECLGQVDTSRATAFRTNHELRDFYERVRSSLWMKHYGYDNLQEA